MRRPIIFLILAITLCFTSRTKAQQCHSSAPLESKSIGLRIGLASEFATYRTSRYEGEYQALSLAAQWDQRWFRFRAMLPTYRIVRNGIENYGLGDIMLDARVPIARTTQETLMGGVGLAATLPTGDANHDLGMGHVMLMPMLWASWTPKHAFLSMQLTYGHALASAYSSHHNTGPMPIVNPMNQSEVEASIIAGYTLEQHIRFRGGVYGAIPVVSPLGASRTAGFIGTDLILDRFDISLEGHVPLVGDPFLFKIILVAGARF